MVTLRDVTTMRQTLDFWYSMCERKASNHCRTTICIPHAACVQGMLFCFDVGVFFKLGSASISCSNSMEPTGTSVNAFVTVYNLIGRCNLEKVLSPESYFWGPSNHLSNQKSGLPEKSSNRWEPTATKNSWFQWVRERCNHLVRSRLQPTVNVA